MDENDDENAKFRKIFVPKSKALALCPSMLKIYVGTKEQMFVIHESALTARSNFFKKAMNGSWKEAVEKVVKLPEDDAEAFEMYTQLVYTGKIPEHDASELSERCGGEEDHLICREEYRALCRLYVLCDKLDDVQAKNTTLEGILRRFMYVKSKGGRCKTMLSRWRLD